MSFNSASPININAKFLRRQQVESITGLSRSTIYREVAAGRFPKPVKLTSKGTRVAWIVTEVYEWMDNRILESRAA